MMNVTRSTPIHRYHADGGMSAKLGNTRMGARIVVRSKAIHDHYKGSIIEYFDTVTPVEKPKKRAQGPGIDVRKEKLQENERRFQALAAEGRKAAKAAKASNTETSNYRATQAVPNKELAKKRRALQKESEKARKKMRTKIIEARKRHADGKISLDERKRVIEAAREICAHEEERIARQLEELR